MPTTIYTSRAIGAVTVRGKQYEVKDGAVDVPDESVADLCESHGFSATAPVKTILAKAPGEKSEPVDVTTLNLKDLIAYGNDEFGLGLSNRVSKADALQAVQEAIAKAVNK